MKLGRGQFDWLRRLRSHYRWQRTLPVLGLSSVLLGSSLWAQDREPQWLDPFKPPASSAANPHSPVRFAWHDDEFDDPVEPNPIRQAAYQNQYPLSKDSDDLLPREDHWRRLEEDSASPLSDDSDFETDELFSDNDASWIEWKKTVGTATWIAPGSSGLGVTSLEARGSIEFPSFQALWFVPRFAAHTLNGPTITDLPGQLYDVSFETVAMLPIGERWFVQAAVAPSFFSDGTNTGRKAIRTPGRALAFWKYSDKLTFVGGVLYLDRDDVKAIPSAGLLWNPNEDWKVELAAPRPRVAWRFSHDEDSDRWAYLVGEFGGGSWAIRRATGVNDVATLSDYRLMAGYERKWLSGKSWLVEAGYVFSRTLKYTSTLGDTDLPSTALVRLGITF